MLNFPLRSFGCPDLKKQRDSGKCSESPPHGPPKP